VKLLRNSCKEISSLTIRRRKDIGMSDSSERTSFEQLLKKINVLEKRLDDIENRLKALGLISSGGEEWHYKLGIVDLLRLPDHLRETMIALSELGNATAEEVMKKTKRVRNLESSYLNQLARMGHVERYRKGRKVIFRARYVRGPQIRRVLEALEKR
jgi:uncharacterized protein Yka (UPF0111/DUF47 family)